MAPHQARGDICGANRSIPGGAFCGSTLLLFMLLPERRHPLLYLLKGKDLLAFCAFVCLIGHPVVDEFIGKIDAVKLEGKIEYAREVFILAGIA
jgi:hypothetical protein